MASCICAAHNALQTIQRWRRSTSPLGEPRCHKHTPRYGSVNLRRLASEASEDGEWILRGRLPDDLAAGLDLSVQACRERLGILLRGGPDDEVAEAVHRPVSLGLELLG